MDLLKLPRLLLIALFPLLMGLYGTWQLPVKRVRTTMGIVPTGEGNGWAILKVYSKRPVTLILKGEMRKEKCGWFMNIESSWLKMGKECMIKTQFIVCGPDKLDKYYADGLVLTHKICKDQPPTIIAERIKEPWTKVRSK